MTDDTRPNTPPMPPDTKHCREVDQGRTLALERRILLKIDESETSAFTTDEQRMFTVFFELAQEYDSRRDFYTACVLLPYLFFAQECRLYLRTGPRAWKLARCHSLPAQLPQTEPPAHSALVGEGWFIPIRGRHDTGELMGFTPADGVIGWLELASGAELDEHAKLFYEKFANRIGFQLHTWRARAKNTEHLAFIQNLVEDIGHNVIVPNMIFKLFFNRLKGSVLALEQMVLSAPEETPGEFLAGLDFLQARLRAQYEEINRHYEQTSLFLETLLRRRHFEEGRYVLEKRMVNLRKQVVEPQVERYRPRMEDRGIHIDMSMGGIPDLPVYLMADLGLISQVYANLFSNAVKYTQPITTPEGRAAKFMAYGLSIEHDAFGPGRDGVKLNVFTTGPVVAEQDRPGLFEPGFRCANTCEEHGTGHGLAFVRQVVDLHGGTAGYEPAPLGNNFYIMLPLEEAREG